MPQSHKNATEYPLSKVADVQDASHSLNDPTASLVGFIDGVTRGRLSGWALDRSHPERRLVVALWNRKGQRRLTLADRYRADVHRNGHGDGYYGFALPVHGIADISCVRALAAHRSIALPIAFAGADPTSRTFSDGSYTLCIDPVLSEGRLVSGWAVDQACSGARRILRLYSDGCFIAQQRATLYRPDAVESTGDGYRGFLFDYSKASGKSLLFEDAEMKARFEVDIRL